MKSSPKPAFLFDLDGTLVDSVYQHVLAWQEALEGIGVKLPNWFIHRRVGMSGGLVVSSFQQETGRILSKQELPGSCELLQTLTKAGVSWAIATSGNRGPAEKLLKLIPVEQDTILITHAEVQHAKPDPDLFLAAADKLSANIENCVVVGDSIWDLLAAQRARALGVGLLSGGYGEDELTRAGAYRVYRDPADLLAHLYETGVRPNHSE
jgi:HAD superfamily hydrolase (TIGR01549 family)